MSQVPTKPNRFSWASDGMPSDQLVFGRLGTCNLSSSRLLQAAAEGAKPLAGATSNLY